MPRVARAYKVSHLTLIERAIMPRMVCRCCPVDGDVAGQEGSGRSRKTMDLAGYRAKDPGLEENPAMGEPENVPGNSGEKPGQDPE